MNDECVADFTDKLVKSASAVLDMFQSGHHPTETQLKRLEGALFPFIGEKMCGHRIIEECECLNRGLVPVSRAD